MSNVETKMKLKPMMMACLAAMAVATLAIIPAQAGASGIAGVPAACEAKTVRMRFGSLAAKETFIEQCIIDEIIRRCGNPPVAPCRNK